MHQRRQILPGGLPLHRRVRSGAGYDHQRRRLRPPGRRRHSRHPGQIRGINDGRTVVKHPGYCAKFQSRANATRVDITVAELPAEDRLVITINDNGCGMTPEQVAHVDGPVLHHPHHPQGGAGSSLFQNGRADDRRGFLHSIAGWARAPGCGPFSALPTSTGCHWATWLTPCASLVQMQPSRSTSPLRYQVGRSAVFTVDTRAVAGDFGRRSPQHPRSDGLYAGVHQRKYWIVL